MNFCKDEKCTSYNNFEKQMNCKYYIRSIVKPEQVRCIFCDYEKCFNFYARKDPKCPTQEK